eukprot:353079-Chlamydomonas_euryale.AAC.1
MRRRPRPATHLAAAATREPRGSDRPTRTLAPARVQQCRSARAALPAHLPMTGSRGTNQPRRRAHRRRCQRRRRLRHPRASRR